MTLSVVEDAGVVGRASYAYGTRKQVVGATQRITILGSEKILEEFLCARCLKLYRLQQ